MTGGAFPDWARAAILEATNHRCAGCGTTQGLTTQHRAARGMGGTSRDWIGMPCNGVPLCGSGTTGCHGWTEHYPDHARALGWRLDQLTPGEMPGPFYTLDGWRSWELDPDMDPADPRAWLVGYVHDPRDRPAPPGDVAAARALLTKYVRALTNHRNTNRKAS